MSVCDRWYCDDHIERLVACICKCLLQDKKNCGEGGEEKLGLDTDEPCVGSCTNIIIFSC